MLGLTSNTTSILKRADDIGSRISWYCGLKNAFKEKSFKIYDSFGYESRPAQNRYNDKAYFIFQLEILNFHH